MIENTSKQLFNIIDIYCKIIYNYDSWGNKNLIKLDEIKHNLISEQVRNKSITYNQYLHLFIDHIKDNIIRKFSSLNDYEIKIKIYNENDSVHILVIKSIDLLLKLIGPLPKPFNYC
jgi:hypothetical protein